MFVKFSALQQLFLLLLIIILWFSIYTTLPQMRWAEVEIRQAKMYKFFLEKPLPNPKIAWVASPIQPYSMVYQIPVQPVIDTTQQHILLTGDSMVGSGIALGLKEFSKFNQHKLTAISFESTTTIHWSKTKILDSLIQVYKPTVVILSLGSNELFTRNIQAHEPYIQDILAQAKGTQFFWVGPPNWQEDTGINALLEKILGKERFFLSKDLKLSRLPDGIHVNYQGSLVWARAFAEWVMTESEYKFKLYDPFEKKEL